MTTRRVTDEQLQELADGLSAAASAAAEFVRAWGAMLEVVDDQEPDPDPDPDPPTATIKPRPSLTTEQAVTVTWDAVPGATAYAVTRDGQDRGGAGAWTDETRQLQHTMTKLLPGTRYRFEVSAYGGGAEVIGSGVVEVTTLAEPEVPPPGPVTPGKFRRIGKSGLKADSLAFMGGNCDLNRLRSFGSQRGREFDGELTFPATEARNWDQIKGGLAAAKKVVDAGLRVVYSIPHAPISEDMNYRGANNDYRDGQRDFGATLKSMGLNTDSFVLRIDWEFNGNWYPWSGNRKGGAKALQGAWYNARDNIRAGAGGSNLFDLCENKRPGQAGVRWEDILRPGDPADILGIDQYDHWGPAKTQAQWEAEVRKGIGAADDLAAKLGVMWSLDETGSSHEGGGNGGGDNPAFWRFLLAELDLRSARCAWWNTYEHDGNPPRLRHSLRQYNQQSWAAYKAELAKR